ncbi:MAG: hypothetical protein KDI71_06795 [Xanthomonadales bacterium]|nr:hypothetical protein [Xanthomonadales bacterium]
MKRVLILLWASCWLICAPLWALEQPPAAQLPPDDGPWVVRVWYPDRAALSVLTAEREPWAVQHREGYVVVQIDDLGEFQTLLDRGFKAQVDADLTALLRQPRGLRSIPGFACYRTVEETLDSLAQMAINFPALAELIDIGDSWEKQQDPGNGYDLKVLKLTNSAIPGPKPRMFAMASMHARELTPAELLTRFAEQLLAGFADDPQAQWLLNQHELYLIPQVNPDGRKFAEMGDFWRKNVNEAYCGATSADRGADLNRNFPFEWGMHNGSSDSPCSELYRGPIPESEPETQALTGFLSQIFPDSRPADLLTPAPEETPGLFIDLHSASGLVIWPWGFDQVQAPNGPALARLGRRLAWFNDYLPQQAIDLYTTDGTTTDFAYGELGVAAAAYELGTVFFESCNAFENRILPDNLASLNYALNVTQAPYLLPRGPQFAELYSALVEIGEPALVLGRLVDNRFGGVLGAEPADNVAGGLVHREHVDQPAIATVQAADGSFDAPEEAVYASVDTSGMASGRYLLVAQGVDQAASNGPPHATWLEIANPGETGQVSGQLTDAASGLAITEVASVFASGFGSLGGMAGYGIRLPPGTHSVHARAPGYLEAQADGVVVQAGNVSTADLALTPICERFIDDAEGSIEWQFGGDWGKSDAYAFSPTQAYTDSPLGDYPPSSESAMTSLPLDLRQLTSVKIEFASRCDTERGADLGRVEYRIGGEGTWTEIYLCTGEPDWKLIAREVPALDGADQVQIRFRLTADSVVERDGWYVDDIRISGGSLSCQLFNQFSDGFEGP